MPWSGSGIFSRIHSWIADKAAAINITASRVDEDSNDFTSGINACLAKNGENTPTANLPMGSFRHTGVGNGVGRADYAAVNQVQDGFLNWVVAGGTADALTATYSPVVSALTDGMIRRVRATAANATTTPTFAPDGLAAHTITKQGGAAVQVGDWSNLEELELQYNLANTRWERINAKPGGTAQTFSAAVTFGGSGTITLPNNNVTNAQLAQAPANTIKGNNTGSTANEADLTVAQTQAMLGLSPPAAGRLSFVSATQIKFSPYNGGFVQIAGVIYAIPSGGITAANTSIFIDGVGGSNLAVSTLYYVYLFNNSGTLTVDFSTTGHATDSTVGNIGIEIKSGVTSRTLIGVVQTNGSSQFADSVTSRTVLSWFNRRNRDLLGASTAAATSTSASLASIAAGANVTALSWSDEASSFSAVGFASNNTSPDVTSVGVGIDTVFQGAATTATSSTGGFNVSHAGRADLTMSEGAHTITPFGSVNAGTGTFSVQVVGTVRG